MRRERAWFGLAFASVTVVVGLGACRPGGAKFPWGEAARRQTRPARRRADIERRLRANALSSLGARGDATDARCARLRRVSRKLHDRRSGAGDTLARVGRARHVAPVLWPARNRQLDR